MKASGGEVGEKSNDSTIPYGYCKCGCGRKTTPWEYTDTTRRERIAGEPRNYIKGHASGYKHKLRVDFTGQVFGAYTVVSRAKNLGQHVMWLCRCSCGTEKIISGDRLKYGKATSCGCLRRPDCYATNRKHGMCETRVYNIWSGMNRRCSNPNFKYYSHYGGRGIQVCERWKSFENFLSDMGDCPEGMELDRINNDGNYEPNNCRWATKKQNMRNRRGNRIIEYNGISCTLTEWSEITGIAAATIHTRINKAGLSPEIALTRPVRVQNKKPKMLLVREEG